MRIPSVLVASILLNFAVSLNAFAQPPFGGGGPPGGGFGGPPGGGFGGPPGGGDRGGGDRGGGDRGSSSRGGPPGGDRGSSGFDPAAMLGRLDANGNGSIDPDEMQGPARFILDRISRDNPEIASAMSESKPISISKITKAIDKMRGDSGSSSSASSNSSSSSSSSQPKVPESLVPGFGMKKDMTSIPGFGVGGSVATTIKIEEKDLKEALDRLQKYDKNKDGILDEKEIAEGSWRDESPMSYDRNGDKKLSVEELAVRYAKRRIAEETEKANKQTASSNSRDSRRGDSRSQKPEAPASPWSNQASYKFTPKFGSNSKTPGLPEWFASSDANNDGQVMMNEYASNWDDATIKEFERFDTNGDGTITTLETLTAVKKGVLRGSAAMVASTSKTSGSPASASSTVTSTVPVVATPTMEIDRSELPADADERWVKFAALQLSKNDKDRNSRLTPDEWSASSGDFSTVDKNGDGSISTGEIYSYLLSKKKK